MEGPGQLDRRWTKRLPQITKVCHRIIWMKNQSPPRKNQFASGHRTMKVGIHKLQYCPNLRMDEYKTIFDATGSGRAANKLNDARRMKNLDETSNLVS